MPDAWLAGEANTHRGGGEVKSLLLTIPFRKTGDPGLLFIDRSKIEIRPYDTILRGS